MEEAYETFAGQANRHWGLDGRARGCHRGRRRTRRSGAGRPPEGDRGHRPAVRERRRRSRRRPRKRRLLRGPAVARPGGALELRRRGVQPVEPGLRALPQPRSVPRALLAPELSGHQGQALAHEPRLRRHRRLEEQDAGQRHRHRGQGRPRLQHLAQGLQVRWPAAPRACRAGVDPGQAVRRHRRGRGARRGARPAPRHLGRHRARGSAARGLQERGTVQPLLGAQVRQEDAGGLRQDAALGHLRLPPASARGCLRRARRDQARQRWLGPNGRDHRCVRRAHDPQGREHLQPAPRPAAREAQAEGLPRLPPCLRRGEPPGLVRRGDPRRRGRAPHGARRATILYVGAADSTFELAPCAEQGRRPSGRATIITNSYGRRRRGRLQVRRSASRSRSTSRQSPKGIGIYFSSGDDGDESPRDRPPGRPTTRRRARR